jgi:hypothetical protein
MKYHQLGYSSIIILLREVSGVSPAAGREAGSLINKRNS